MKSKEEYLEDSMRYRATDLNSMSETARILRAMQEFAEQYHKEQTRDELKDAIAYGWKYVNENGWTTVDIVIDEYLKNK